MQEKVDVAMRVATFRFGVIADFVTGTRLGYGEKSRLLVEKAARSYEIPASEQTRISISTIHQWVSSYRKGGYRIEALCPKSRADRGSYTTLDTTLRMAVKGLREENPYYTLPVIIKKLRLAKILAPDQSVNKATLYRFLRQENLKKPSEEAQDRRRFEAEHSNECWQCDVLHGPQVFINGSKNTKKAYLMAIIDDHSRLIVHARFYLAETFEILKDALKDAISRRGIPQKFYVDNGACYRSEQLERILASLGTALSHTPPYRPQGRGKIERWFKNIRDSFLPMLPTESLVLEDLNELLDDFVDEYNNTLHSSIKETPYERYARDLACVRPAPERLLDYFRRREYRQVKKDRCVQLHGRIFEVSYGLIDKTVELYFHNDRPEDVEVVYQGASYGPALPLDRNLNAKLGRDWDSHGPRKDHKPNSFEIPSIQSAPPTQAGNLFESMSPKEDEVCHDS